MVFLMANYECKVCRYKCNTKEEMREHVRTKHLERIKQRYTFLHRIKPILYILSYLIMVWYMFGLGIAQIIYAPFSALAYLGSPNQTPVGTLLYTLIIITLILFLKGWYIIYEERER